MPIRPRSKIKFGAGITIRANIKPAIKSLGRIQGQVRNELLIAMKRAVIMVEAEAKRLIKSGYYRPAIDTSRLIGSVSGRIKEATATRVVGIVGTNVYYAIYVHEGTWFMLERPFLVDALKNKEPKIIAMIHVALKKTLGKVP